MLLLLICAGAAVWLLLNLLVVIMCRSMSRAEDVHLSLLALLCLRDEHGRWIRPTISTRRPRRAVRRLRCRPCAKPPVRLPERRQRPA